MSAFDASSASTSSSSSGRSSPLAIRRAAGVSSTRDALSTSAVSAGMRAVARGVLGPRERGTRRLRPETPHRRSPQPPARGWPSTRGERRGIESRERPLGLVEAADQQQAPYLEIPGMRGVDAVAMRFQRRPRRVERLRRPAQVARRRARSRPRRRRTSRGPPPLSDRRRARLFATAPSLERDRRAAPSRCLASASAGASSRSATRFNAPSGSPAASARAAAVISESIGIPPHLSLPPFDTPG